MMPLESLTRSDRDSEERAKVNAIVNQILGTYAESEDELLQCCRKEITKLLRFIIEKVLDNPDISSTELLASAIEKAEKFPGLIKWRGQKSLVQELQEIIGRVKPLAREK